MLAFFSFILHLVELKQTAMLLAETAISLGL
jgi:hypothetical protein